MKFSIDCHQLRKAVSRASAVLSVRNKEFYGINLGMTNGQLHIFASNGEEMLRESLTLDADKCTPSGEGYVFCGLDRFDAIVSKEEGPLEISSEGNLLKVQSGSSWYKIPVQEPKLGFEQWPRVDRLRHDFLVVNSSNLGRAFSLCGITDSIELYRAFNLNRVTLSFDDDLLHVVTADPRRMVVADCRVEDRKGWESYQVSLPDHSCAYAMSIFPEKDKQSSSVTIAVDGASVIFESESRAFIGRQMLSQVPAWRKFIRRTSDCEIRVAAAELLEVLQRSNVLFDANCLRLCRLTGRDGKLVLSCSTPLGSSETVLGCEGFSVGKVHGMDPQYAIDFLRRLHGTEEVVLGINDTSSLLSFRADGVLCMVAEMQL